MNRIKRVCALLLAIMLAVGVALQPGIGGVFANKTEQTEQITEPATEPITEPMMEPAAEPITEPATDLAEEPVAEPATDLAAEPVTEPTEEPTPDLAAEPVTEPMEEPVPDLAAEPVAEPATDSVTEESGYIYFDLAAGNVTIGKSTYSGSVFVDGDVKPVSGTHAAENKYYVYQSTEANRLETGYEKTDDYTNKTNCRIPVYNRVQNGEILWTDYVTNNTDVKKVSENWENAAAASGRTATKNRITFNSESGYSADVTIDNIWTSYRASSAEGRTTGGIGANLKNSNINCLNTHIQLRLKGDSRVGCVHYSAGEGNGNQIIFSNGETEGTPGSITVADFPGDYKANHWSSAIGGADNPAGIGDKADGIVINSGVIYAGTTPEDNCTAIGGGGNDYGGVTINGGVVTAVVSSTGTAIGGGIGYGNAGGNTDVIITDGTIYAYNLGIVYGQGDKFAKFIPAAAIGGGGSRDQDGNKKTNITISGGTVYAQSKGGAAIGGGCSASKLGGRADITITGGTIIAKSTGGTYEKKDDISAGVSIGGGTGKTGGGSVTLNISGENTVVRTGSIGGGKTTGTGNIGSADVTISGGDITGQVIMAGGAAKNCTFTMTGGRIHSTNLIEGNSVEEYLHDPRPDVKIEYLEKNGGAVWMQDINGQTRITGGTIEECYAYRGGAVYMEGGTFTLSGGTIQKNVVKIENPADPGTTGRGGGVYVTGGTATIEGGTICQNSAQVRGGGLYVTSEGERKGTVTVNNGSISRNIAGFASDGITLYDNVGRGGGVYLEDGLFTMTGGDISGNTANYRGGGIFLTKKPTLTQGTISGNTARNSGGGLCINGDELELTSADMQIYGNTAQKGGGVAVLNGDFILKGGAVGVESGKANHAEKGGGVYVEAENTGGTTAADAGNTGDTTVIAASVTVNSGNIWYNSATEGGGIYLAKGEGTFTLNGENASINNNTADNGGGIYLYKAPLLNQGMIAENTATINGGGMYISDCLVTLKPEKDVIITQNGAKNGAGIYIHGSSGSSESSGSTVGVVDSVSSASPTNKVGLLVASGSTGTVHFTNNTATESGGAVCVDTGRFQLESNNITVTGNRAANGGGAYVNGGKLIMLDGFLANNTADESGGGAYVNGAEVNGKYVNGEFHMLGGTIGGTGSGNRAKNGGGVCVSEGNVTVVYGIISHNYAEQDGGGFYVSAVDSTVKVLMLSGSLSSNQAENNGGGMAVESNNDKPISVEIGCLRNHNVENGSPQLPIPYEGEYESFAEYYGVANEHKSCPEVNGNKAGNIGGGFYMNSAASTLSFFCVEESGNTAAKGHENSEGMDVEGGRVIIGDEYYHNHEYAETLQNRQGAPWGYISMDNATIVNGGQVDIYGDMNNPIFRDEVTVDIEDTKNDHFMDHRRAHTTVKSYKVHYIENFQGTGLYQAVQYDEGNTDIIVEGALYNRPGYTILGWCTEASTDVDGAYYYEVGTKINLASGSVPGMGTHSINCDICGVDEVDENLLELYAIWEANGYSVVFDPNVPVGDTYTGSMENQIHQYGVEQALTKNAYKYAGHIFNGWNTKADGTGTAYEDGEVVKNLTNKNGAEVVLYAQWTPCDHEHTPHWFSYDVVNEGKTLRRICSCGGQTLTATLYAEDTVYDGHCHPATLTLDDEEAWGDDAPTIVYTSAWPDGDGLSHEPDTAPELSTDGKPFHAGKYTASITKTNKVNGETDEEVTASIVYTIAKAEQEAPEKPEYDVDTTNNQAIIKKLALDPTEITDAAGNIFKPRAEYCLTFVNDTNIDWQKMPEEGKLTITPTQALTNYFVLARYEELEDYKASDPKKADATYFFAGNVTVTIVCDDGIECKDVVATGTTMTDGVTLTLETENDYYLVGGEYTVTTKLTMKNESMPLPEPPPSVTQTDGADNIYSVTNIPPDSNLTIYIGTAKKKPQIQSQVVPGQVFRSITGTSADISRDSAFTVAFQISNFDPYYEEGSNSYGVYSAPELTFGSALPAKTTIILLNRGKNGEKTYWYYRVTSAVASVPLTAFRKMGGNESETYSIPKPAKTNGQIDLSYQFIVDFSQCANSSDVTGGYSESSLKMTLEAPIKDSSNAAKAPEVKSAVDVTMKNSGFEFEKTAANGLTNSFKCTFNQGIAASKWGNRASALVLTPKNNLPPDAQIKAEIDDGTTYLCKNGDSFIIPLSLLQGETKTVDLTLQSALFPVEKADYSFDAKWLISPSKAGKAPRVGDQAGELLNVTFTSAERVIPSLKSEGVNGQSRILTREDILKLDIRKRKMDGYTISAALLRKAEDGTYSGTGWNQKNVSADSLSVPLGGQVPGSFCLMLTVKQTDSITTVMEVPYYFIIKP